MKLSTLSAILLSVSILTFSACDKEEDDPCTECQQAIAHMGEKIADNACNPDYMENAMSRLRSDCGSVSANRFAAFMSHTCYFEGSVRYPYCESEEGDILTHDLTVKNTQFELRTDEGNLHTVEIQIYTDAEPIIYELAAGQEVAFTEDEHLRDGQEIDVIVLFEGDIIRQETVTFDLYRGGDWFSPREIEVRYDFLQLTYYVSFYNW